MVPDPNATDPFALFFPTAPTRPFSPARRGSFSPAHRGSPGQRTPVRRGRSGLADSQKYKAGFKPTVGSKKERRAQSTDQRHRERRERSVSRARFAVPDEDITLAPVDEDTKLPAIVQEDSTETNASNGTDALMENINQINQDVASMVAEYNEIEQDLHPRNVSWADHINTNINAAAGPFLGSVPFGLEGLDRGMPDQGYGSVARMPSSPSSVSEVISEIDSDLSIVSEDAEVMAARETLRRSREGTAYRNRAESSDSESSDSADSFSTADM